MIKRRYRRLFLFFLALEISTREATFSPFYTPEHKPGKRRVPQNSESVSEVVPTVFSLVLSVLKTSGLGSIHQDLPRFEAKKREDGLVTNRIEGKWLHPPIVSRTVTSPEPDSFGAEISLWKKEQKEGNFLASKIPGKKHSTSTVCVIFFWGIGFPNFLIDPSSGKENLRRTKPKNIACLLFGRVHQPLELKKNTQCLTWERKEYFARTQKIMSDVFGWYFTHSYSGGTFDKS